MAKNITEYQSSTHLSLQDRQRFQQLLSTHRSQSSAIFPSLYFAEVKGRRPEVQKIGNLSLY